MKKIILNSIIVSVMSFLLVLGWHAYNSYYLTKLTKKICNEAIGFKLNEI